MIPSAFEYFAPTTLSEAISLLNTYQDDAKVLAGGHSLIPLMKLRLAAPKYIIDIGRIADLSYIKESDGSISIGGMTTHYLIESSDLLKRKCPLLPEVARSIGDVQVRNRGTIGGSLAHADPAADWPAAILALGAKIKAAGPNGERTINAGDFFVDMLTSAIAQGEILTEITVPAIGARAGYAYEKVPQSASGFAIVGVAVQISVDDNNICRSVGIGVTGVTPKPFRAAAVEDALRGRAVDDQLIETASGRLGVNAEDALGDIHASAEYRVHLAAVHTRRALKQALARI